MPKWRHHSGPADVASAEIRRRQVESEEERVTSTSGAASSSSRTSASTSSASSPPTYGFYRCLNTGSGGSSGNYVRACSWLGIYAEAETQRMLERVRAPEREERMLPREPFRIAHTMGEWPTHPFVL